MKAVVMEVNGRYAIVMTKKCEFIKIKHDGFFKPGFEVDVPEVKKNNIKFFMKAASIAAAVLLVGGISLGSYAYNTPYSYVSVDINPSVELTANRFDIVIGAKGLNDDGIDVLQNQNLLNKKVKDGVNVIVSEAVEKGYLSKDKEGAVLLTVSSKNQTKADEMKVELEEKTIKEANDIGVKVDVMSQNAALERRDQAFEMGITPGRLNLIQKLISAGAEKDVDEFEDVPVKDIMKEVKDLKLEDKEIEKEDKQKDKQKENKNDKGNTNKKSESTVTSGNDPEKTVKPQSTPPGPEENVRTADQNQNTRTEKTSRSGIDRNNRNTRNNNNDSNKNNNNKNDNSNRNSDNNRNKNN